MTKLYSSGADEATKDSAAALLKHSRKMQQSVYDRRDPQQRKGLAQSALGKRAERSEPAVDRDVATKKASVRFVSGDIVVVPNTASFRLARVLNTVDSENTLTLMELVRCGEMCFKPAIGIVWSENASLCHHVLCDLDRETGRYQLQIPEADIVFFIQKSK